MDFLALTVAALVVWLLGASLLMALRTAAPAQGGEAWWIGGTGYLLGAFVLTLWMRGLSLAGIRFSAGAIALPLIVVTIACLGVWWRRQQRELRVPRDRTWGSVLVPPLRGVARVIWFALLAWLAVRFVLLGIEVVSRPLYPWDAWTQWATKARVWYELGYVAPFARADEWFAANGKAYLDASPEYPPTMPLLQVWNCIVMGRWDDSLMNVPWWQIAIALTCAVYGGLRSLQTDALPALVGAFLVASLPLANVHVALAGYADLPLAAYYVTAVLAVMRWAHTRNWREAIVALVLAIACTQIKNPGWFWAATLVPAVLVVLLPKHGIRISMVAFAAAALLLVVLGRMKLTLFNYQIDLNYDPPWRDLGESYFLLGNWNLLWYGAIIVLVLARKDLLSRSLAPVTITIIGGLLFLFFVFGFTNASTFISDQTTVNRATLHLAPVIVVFIVLGWQAFAARWRAAHEEAPSPSSPVVPG